MICSVIFMSNLSTTTVVATDVETLTSSVDAAKTLVAKIKDTGQNLIYYANDNDYDNCQLMSNAKDDKLCKYSYLIDGREGSVFHTVASGVTPNTYHNLQMNLKVSVTKFQFTMTAGKIDHNFPNNLKIYASNDDAVGLDPETASSEWTEVAQINSGFPTDGPGISFTSPEITMNQAYKYLRFDVLGTTSGNLCANNYPYFDLSEFSVTSSETPRAVSEYYAVSGMQVVVDALVAQIADAESKISAGTATISDVTALQNAINAVEALSVDRSALDDAMKLTLDSAFKVYWKYADPTDELITDVSQISTNNLGDYNLYTDSTDYKLDNLVDHKCSIGYSYFSFWDYKMSDPKLTTETWTTFLATPIHLSDYGPITSYEGTNTAGYHNLQIKLNNPLRSVIMRYWGVKNRINHDNPNDIEVYGTNDDALGAKTLASDNDQWIKIDEIVESNMPDICMDAPYTKYLDLGDSYKYLRFVVKSTTSMNKREERIFAHPELTGVTFGLQEFQLYENSAIRNASSISTAMQDAITELGDLANTYAGLGKETMINDQRIVALRTAMNKVRYMDFDVSNFNSLYETYLQAADSSKVGTDIGCVDADGVAATLKSSLEAARTQAFSEPHSQQNVDAAIESMKSAYQTLISHVVMPKPNTWYTIKSSSVNDSLANCPLKLTQKYALYSEYNQYWKSCVRCKSDNTDGPTDPYSKFRLVPVEGKTGRYYIQYMGTGVYMSPYSGFHKMASVQPEKEGEYELIYCGRKSFKFHPCVIDEMNNNLTASTFEYYAPTARDVSHRPVNHDTINIQHQQEFYFEPMADKIVISWNNNNMDVCVMPWAINGEEFTSLNPTAVMYNIVAFKVDSTANKGKGSTTIGLKKKDNAYAGEPFILVVGDLAQSSFGGTTQLYFNTASIVEEQAQTIYNGAAVGTLVGTRIRKPGLGYFEASILKIPDPTKIANAKYWILPRSGYVNPNLFVDEGITPDFSKTYNRVMVTDIKDCISSSSTEKVDVYSIEGVMIKKQVPASDAQTGLNSGLYIIGKQKVKIQ